MSELKAKSVLQAIDDGYDRIEETAREYIGASIIGTGCDAALAFNLRGFPNDPPHAQLRRIFKIGHVIEDMVVSDLKDRGDVRVWEKDSITGRQFSYRELGGHVTCHLDGMIQVDDASEEIMGLEIKSMNDASFQKFKTYGVRVSHRHYFDQMQLMMSMSKLKKFFFIAYNKNNSEYHAEIVEGDEIEQEYLLARIERVLKGEARKVSDTKTDWRCRDCFKRSVCWESVTIPQKCATCKHATPRSDGLWHCTLFDKIAENPCERWEAYEPKAKK